MSPADPSPTQTRHTLPTGADTPSPPTDAPGDLPERFGRYRIVRKLGQGGMGAVYLAHDTELDRQVALKVQRFAAGDGDSIERFKREARSAATLHHPNLCPVFDVGEVDGRHYLTMAYVEGRSLAELIRGGQPLPERPVADLVRKLALALAEAHRKGVVHRDLKPANIMVDERHEPVILDFGLARQVQKEDVRLTAPGTVLGTPAYMPPEQVRGDTAAMGPSCDVYSLGVVLYELLTGQLPFQGATIGALISQVLTENPSPPSVRRPGIDARLETICLKAMAKEPGQRFGSMAEFAANLAGFLNNDTTAPLPGLTGSTAQLAPPTPSGTGLATQLIAELVARLEASKEPPRRATLWPWIAAGALAVLVAVLVWVIFLRPDPQPIGPATIVVHIHIGQLDPGVKFVLIGDRRIPREELGEPVTLPTGDYAIRLEHADGQVLEAGKVSLGKEDDDKTIAVSKDKVEVVAKPEVNLPRLPEKVKGTNLGAAVLLVDGPAEYGSDWTDWLVSNLVAPPGKGAYAAPCKAPIAVVVGFSRGRLAQITALGVNPTTSEAQDKWVREVEFEVSGTHPFTGFRKVGKLDVEPVPTDAIYRLEKPETARYVRFTFLRNGGGSHMELNKVLVFGALVKDDGPPPLSLVNVALTKNGGKVNQVSSEYDDSWKAANLIDGNPGLGWSSKSGEKTSSVTLELARLSAVRHVVINPYSREYVENAVREAEVFLSKTEKDGDFHSVGKLTMEEGIGRDYSLDLKTPTMAQFVRVQFLKNGGGSYVQAHEIKVFAELDRDQLEKLYPELFNGSALTRKKAAERLKERGDRAAVPALVQRVSDEREDDLVYPDKTAAVDALVKLAPDQAAAALLEGWQVHESPRRRVWTARRLAAMREQMTQADRRQAARFLAEHVGDDRPDDNAYADKTEALKALRVIDPDEAKAALERATRSSNRQVVEWVKKQ